MKANLAHAPLIVHVVYRFDVGGLENGVVNLINRLPPQSWRHAVLALTEIDAGFASRITRQGVRFFALHKSAGHAFPLYPRLFRLFRELRPTVVHTRNIAALEASVPAWAAAVPVRVHGEHGRDVDDLDGSSAKYQWVRRAFSPFVTRYVALSPDLETYLREQVGIAANRIEQIYNGVDTIRFHPTITARAPIEGCPFNDADHWLVGTVGRMETVKDPINLARAFARAVQLDREARRRMRLVLVGEGRLRPQVEALLAEAGVRDLAWVAGERADVASMLQGLDCFVLPSLAEGVSNTILEAMATALPVVATRVGANGELVEDGVTGRLVPAADSDALAHAMIDYFRDPSMARGHGLAGRQIAERRFSLERMVEAYQRLYDALIPRRGHDVSDAPAATPGRHTNG
jgi:sugar transferase (PEP-CTERM/EpsH1 system associated)